MNYVAGVSRALMLQLTASIHQLSMQFSADVTIKQTLITVKKQLGFCVNFTIHIITICFTGLKFISTRS